MICLYPTLIDPLLRDIRIFTPRFSGMKKGDRILDICCGTGDQVFYYERIGAIVAGIDLNPEMIGIAQKWQRKYGSENSYFQGADATDLPFEDPVFDFTSISLALHEIERDKRDKVISEMKRVTKKDGFLIFIDFQVPLPKKLISFFIKAIEYFAGKEHRQNFKDYISQGGLPVLLEKNKLKIEKRGYLKDGFITIIKAKNI